MKTLIITTFFEPAFKAGGPIKSLRNMLNSNIFEEPIILTNDYDYDGSKLDEHLKKISLKTNNIFYLKNVQHIKFFFSMMFKKEIKLIYINGFFNPLYQLYLISYFFLKDIKIIISPRGSLGRDELSIKPLKKMLLLRVLKFLFWLRPQKKIVFHVTSDREVKDIRRIFNYKNIECAFIKNLIDTSGFYKPIRTNGLLNIVFLSRVSLKKNIHISKDIFSHVQNINFSIFGPFSSNEETYFKNLDQSLKKIKKINYSYMGSIKPSSIKFELNKYDVFFLPTLGENFGHAIVEAMLSGLIIVISDKTPWNKLSNDRFLWCVKDNDIQDYIKVFNKISLLNKDEIFDLKKDSYEFFQQFFSKNNIESIKEYKKLFSI